MPPIARYQQTSMINNAQSLKSLYQSYEDFARTKLYLSEIEENYFYIVQRLLAK